MGSAKRRFKERVLRCVAPRESFRRVLIRVRRYENRDSGGGSGLGMLSANFGGEVGSEMEGATVSVDRSVLPAGSCRGGRARSRPGHPAGNLRDIWRCNVHSGAQRRGLWQP